MNFYLFSIFFLGLGIVIFFNFEEKYWIGKDLYKIFKILYKSKSV